MKQIDEEYRESVMEAEERRRKEHERWAKFHRENGTLDFDKTKYAAMIADKEV